MHHGTMSEQDKNGYNCLMLFIKNSCIHFYPASLVRVVHNKSKNPEVIVLLMSVKLQGKISPRLPFYHNLTSRILQESVFDTSTPLTPHS